MPDTIHVAYIEADALATIIADAESEGLAETRETEEGEETFVPSLLDTWHPVTQEAQFNDAGDLTQPREVDETRVRGLLAWTERAIAQNPTLDAEQVSQYVPGWEGPNGTTVIETPTDPEVVVAR